MQNNKVTIHDIAKALNLDSSTVSRALNDSPRVIQKTKDIVLAKAAEMGYQRNHLASSLRKSKTNTIGVIVPRISRHFFSSVISGIEETAYEAGYTVIICQSLEEFNREKKIINTLMGQRVDGVLMSISMETKDYKHLEVLKKQGIQLVFFDRHCDIPNYSNVLIDDFKGGFEATEHLILKGCKHIAHFSGPQNLEIYKNRFKGYKHALSKHGLPFEEALVFPSKLMEDDGRKNSEKLLALPNPVDGIFSANDVAAIGAMKYLTDKGVKIPEDIAIVGFSNEPISTVINPALTTINQPGIEMGKAATELLLKHITKENGALDAQTIIMDSNLIERQSSKK